MVKDGRETRRKFEGFRWIPRVKIMAFQSCWRSA